MGFGRRNVGIVFAALLVVALIASVLGGCGKSSGTTSTQSTGTTVSSATGGSIPSTTTTMEHKGAAQTFVKVGEVVEVEQGELSVFKVTVTDNLASDAANALLLTGAAGETKNASKSPAAGNEFLMITFKYKKLDSYPFRGGLYPDDILLKDSGGKEIPSVETNGFGGIYQSDAGTVKAGVEAQTTAVYEVPKGSTGLVLVYHERAVDGFTCTIR